MNRKERRAQGKHDSGTTLMCSIHGKQDWEGHMRCNFCKHVYDVHRLPPVEVVDRDGIQCSCGKRITPTEMSPVCGPCGRAGIAKIN